MAAKTTFATIGDVLALESAKFAVADPAGAKVYKANGVSTRYIDALANGTQITFWHDVQLLYKPATHKSATIKFDSARFVFDDAELIRSLGVLAAKLTPSMGLAKVITGDAWDGSFAASMVKDARLSVKLPYLSKGDTISANAKPVGTAKGVPFGMLNDLIPAASTLRVKFGIKLCNHVEQSASSMFLEVREFVLIEEGVSMQVDASKMTREEALAMLRRTDDEIRDDQRKKLDDLIGTADGEDVADE